MAGRSIALEMLLLQMAPEGLSRASRLSCAKLQCGEQLCSHCSTAVGARPPQGTGGWEQAPESWQALATRETRYLSVLVQDTSFASLLHHFLEGSLCPSGLLGSPSALGESRP